MRAGTTEELSAKLPFSSLWTGVLKGFFITVSSSRIYLSSVQSNSTARHSLREAHNKVSVRATPGDSGPRLEHSLESSSKYLYLIMQTSTP